MRPFRLFPILVVAAIAPGIAHALTCYVVFDRADNVIYRDLYPPVDLSDAGRAERDAMRSRGEFLLFVESDQCPRIEYFTGTAGNVSLRLDETLAPSPKPAADPAKPAPGRAPVAPQRKSAAKKN